MQRQNHQERPAALITGAGTRLGSQFALHLAEQGFDIALHCNRSQTAAATVAQSIQAKGVDCDIMTMDFSSDFDAEVFIGDVTRRFPRLSCLINSASVYDAVTTLNTERDLLEQQFKVNFFAPYLLTRSFARYVQRVQTVANAQVINIIDNKIAYQQYHYSAYLLSKKTLAEFTKLAAIEFAPNVRVNGIAPGVILPMDSRSNDYIDWRIEGIPLQRKGNPNHLLKALDYVLQNDFVCGQIMVVDGGESQNIIGRHSENYVAKDSPKE